MRSGRSPAELAELVLWVAGVLCLAAAAGWLVVWLGSRGAAGG